VSQEATCLSYWPRRERYKGKVMWDL